MVVWDVHCHIFNGSLIKEMVLPYAIQNADNMSLGQGAQGNLGSILSFWRWLREIADSLTASEEDNQIYLLQRMNHNLSDPEDWDIEFATVPLMMDIHYMFSDPLQAGQSVPSGPLYVCDSMQRQIDTLQHLSQNQNCFPFIAVDPRRTGLIDAIISGKYVTKVAGGFYGIKLYPRLGYHPMSGDLPRLYAYCASNGIPITTHCSDGGFPPWHTDSGAFCDPECFRPALEANPKLTIDFAHWGYGNGKWADSILDLMGKFDNVYSDLSCYTGKDDLTTFKAKYWDNPLVRQRTMYGSDYDIFYFTKTSMDLDLYIKSFKDCFSSSELVVMMSQLPERFLGQLQSSKVIWEDGR